jgi:hypothetical protein
MNTNPETDRGAQVIGLMLAAFSGFLIGLLF